MRNPLHLRFLVSAFWIPAFAGMTPTRRHYVYRFIHASVIQDNCAVGEFTPTLTLPLRGRGLLTYSDRGMVAVTRGLSPTARVVCPWPVKSSASVT